MSRILVMSDSHGETEGLRKAIQQVWRQFPGPIDAYVHCGDGAWSFRGLTGELFYHDPKAQFHVVKGNCDFGADVADDDTFELGGWRIFVCHGHRYRVKMGLTLLAYAAAERQCALALYGHTHIPAEDTSGGVTMLNPGAVEDGRIGLLELEEGRMVFHRLQMNRMGELTET